LPFQDPSQALAVEPDVGYDGHPDHCALTHPPARLTARPMEVLQRETQR